MECEAEGGGVGRDGDVHGAGPLALCAPQTECHHSAGAVAHFLAKEARTWVVNHAPVDPNDEVEPWLDGKLQVCVSQHLEAKQVLLVVVLLSGILAVETGYEAVERIEHSGKSTSGGRFEDGGLL